ncbi:hypothetical protein LMG24238_06885 [Paraburkholderia sediminicola]|uniref:Transmembrane protein n=1 Tax=Paraburkholderia sediminicola TaxID=458836 RepID=A0A6J5CTS3_9BURK|nr:hypothetical protein [Paraburkholderia sediminicola]CAB3742454.1 hypothetical protein LMG24238_06885 [Paraburkholderia sediminicola]
MRTASIWAALVAVVILVTSIYGGAHFYSPIPWMDQWDGFVGFYNSVHGAPFETLFQQHNEHRIVFSRLLFLTDIWAFGGMNAFTVVANYVLAALIAFLVWTQARRNSASDSLLAGALSAAMLMSWMQRENLAWGFQSQGFAVYLFALLAFAQYSRGRLLFALVLCLCATYSMGNGVAAFFVLAIQALLLRRPAKDVVIAIVAGAATATAYFWKFVPSPIPKPPGHGIVAQIKFALVFLGNPLYYMHAGLIASAILGLVSLAFAAYLVVRLYRARSITPYQSFLIAGYGLVVASILGAAHARWPFGLPEAASSRYTTPALIGLLLLALLALNVAPRARKAIAIISAAFVTLLLPYQATAFGDNSYLYTRKLAVLATKIGQDNEALDLSVYPGHLNYLTTSGWADAWGIGPYGKGWLHDAGIVKYDPALRDDGRCIGTLDEAKDGSARGWLVAKMYRNGPTLVVLVHNGQTVGYGVSGEGRPDVKRSISIAPADAGWRGFTPSDDVQAYAWLGGRFCALPASR